MPSFARTALLLCVALAAAAVSRDGRVLAGLSRPDTTLACVQPSLAASGTDVFVTCGRGEAVLVARAIDGAPFGPLRQVGTLRSLALGHRRGPRIAVSAQGLVVTATGSLPGSGTTELVAWRSADRGASWSVPVRVTDAPNAAQEGLHALGAAGHTAAVAWLDTRRGSMRVFSSVSTDGGASWTANAEVYASPGGAVCTCCHPSILVAENGDLTVMFRNDLDGKRDMYVKTGAGPAWMLGVGHWTLSACPMDGGGIARSAAGRVLSVWRREQTVFQAAPGEPERRLGDGKDAAVAFVGEEPVFAWTSPSGLVVTPGETRPATVVDPAGGFAAIAGVADRTVVLAWQRGEVSVVRRLPPAAEPEATHSGV